jgi:hypothetical protein
MKIFLDKPKLREFITDRPALRELLNRIIQVEMKGHQVATKSHKKIQSSLVKVETWANIKPVLLQF